MSNSAQEILALWQKQFQAFLSDPAVITATLNNNKAFQDYLHEFYQQSSATKNGNEQNSSANGDVPEHGNGCIAKLAERITELEGRIAQLEAVAPKHN